MDYSQSVVDKAGANGSAVGWAAPSSLYLHIPFCPYKCPYCDFVTHVGSPSLVQPYVDALCTEIERMRSADSWAGYPQQSGADALLIAEQSPFPSLNTIFLGGGTPSMLSSKQVGLILESTARSVGIAAWAEITIEANPDAVDSHKLAGYRADGVNRISLGVQSLNREELRLLGRGHEPEDVATAVRMARRAGFESLSLDLIYGVQEQTLESWQETLQGALALAPDHLSLYSLIVEPKTRYHQLEARGALRLPSDDLVADMYRVACETLDRAGFIHYEVANWALPGHESRHNLTYWHDEQFLAAGVGAYDYLRPNRSVRIRSVKRYIELIQSGASVIAERDHITPEIERFETAAMELRLLREGLKRPVFDERFPEGLDRAYGGVVEGLVSQGLLVDDGESVRIPEDKVPLGNEIWERFLPG